LRAFPLLFGAPGSTPAEVETIAADADAARELPEAGSAPALPPGSCGLYRRKTGTKDPAPRQNQLDRQDRFSYRRRVQKKFLTGIHQQRKTI
jgi:hypothetical protein